MNFEVVGIATNVEDATVKTTKPGRGPQKAIKTTKVALATLTAGKMFLALTDFDPDTPNVIGMLFNGQQVKIYNNEIFMGTNSIMREGNYKAYPFDIPMRFLEEPFPKDFTIQFLLGTMVNEDFIEESRSEVFQLTITE